MIRSEPQVNVFRQTQRPGQRQRTGFSTFVNVAPLVSAPRSMANVQQVFRRTGSRRPVDKSIICVTKAAVAAAQVTTDLVTATFPCTIVGLRWSISHLQDAGTGASHLYWAIIVLRDGQTADTVATSDGATLYNPEQEVLAWGVSNIDNNTETKTMTGSTKTMRKLMGGDKLVFACIGVATNTSTVRAIVQFFCKT